MANKPMEKCSISLPIRKTQIEITMRCYFTPTNVAILQKTDNNVGEDVGKLEPLYTASENTKWHSHFGKQSGDFFK